LAQRRKTGLLLACHFPLKNDPNRRILYLQEGGRHDPPPAKPTDGFLFSVGFQDMRLFLYERAI
jgi:hypothetical protein